MALLHVILASLALLPQIAYGKSIREARQEIVQRSLDYLAVPYLWGGTLPRVGLDCSAFVQLIYRKAGFHLPRVSSDQFLDTFYLEPKEPLPADLVFFAIKGPRRVDHVGLYLGQGYFVHASYTQGVHIDHMSNPYYYSRLIGIRKFKGF